MADNPIIDNGTLPDFTVSADEAASGYVQRMKIAYSANGSDTLVQADASGVLVNVNNALNLETTQQSVKTATEKSATAVVATNDAVTGTDKGGVFMSIRDDALTILGVTDGRFTPDRVDAYGAKWVQIAGAFSSAYDSFAIGTPTAQIWKSYNDTSLRGAGSAQVIWDPSGGKKIAITSIDINSYGTTGGRVFVFFSAAADLTYNAGTDQPVFIGSFAPSSSSKPGALKNPTVPIICANADYNLMYQNDAAISIDIVVYGYEI